MEKKKVTRIVLIVLFALLIVSALLSTTYALFSVDAYGAQPNDFSTGMLAIEAVSKSDTISLTNALPMTDEEGKQTTPYVFSVKNTGNLDYQFDIELLSTGEASNTFPASIIKLQIDNGEVTTLAEIGGKIKDDVILLAGESMDVSIRIWLSKDDTTNDHLGMSFNSKIVTNGQAIYTSSNKEYDGPVPLVEYLTNKYLEANPTQATVANNGIYYYYAPSVSMMNDGMGSNHTWEDGVNAGNIRYYGANPKNYIDIGDVYTEDTVINNMEKNSFLITRSGVQDEESCHAFFNCDINYESLGDIVGLDFNDEVTCRKVFDYESTDEICGIETKKAGEPVLYRIIGVFKNLELSDGTRKDLVKIMREDSIGLYAWDLTSADDSTMTYDNNWHDATLMTVLNNGYLKSMEEITHYYLNIFTLTRASFTTDFTKSGINSIQNKIANVVWNLGGWDNDAYANEIYEYERGDLKCSGCTYETEWIGKIALAYPSDLGYGADLSICSSDLGSYIECNSVNWMSSLSNGSSVEWLLTPVLSGTNFVWGVGNGYVSGNKDVCVGFGVRPVFYLNSELVKVSGDGMKENPYVIR